ncbi:hypothetical protein IH879_06810 [candidate division KSB1 bacterium]|nr:hypothetical protein [candidate division KSB1 bacterium]
MKKNYHGVVDGNIIRLKENLDVPNGTQALVKLKALNKEKQEEIKKRQLKLLQKGFSLGGKLYTNRQDLHVR